MTRNSYLLFNDFNIQFSTKINYLLFLNQWTTNISERSLEQLFSFTRCVFYRAVYVRNLILIFESVHLYFFFNTISDSKNKEAESLKHNDFRFGQQASKIGQLKKNNN